MHLIAEVKPSDILIWIFQVVLGIVGIAIALWVGLLLVQPFLALLTGREVSEDSVTLWFWIVVAAAIAGVLYWQFS